MAGPKKGEEQQQPPEKAASEKLMVTVRIRPLSNDEKLKGCYRITDAIDKNMVLLQEQATDKNDHLRKNRFKDKKFVYDHLFNDESTQKEVYDDTAKPLVQDVLSGFSATVFAYGATGAGKTFTMVGTQEHPGIMVRALNDLFQTLVGENPNKTKITMSYLEIYNENIRDLLEPGGTLELREDAKTGVIQVSGLSEKSILSTKEVMKLLHKGNKERTCEPTAANKTSSRSHALLQVNVRRSNLKGESEEVKNGRLFMVDLAGSERAKKTQNKGKRLQEGAHINRSLLALGNCINALAEGRAKWVNYRDSKLTRLLKDALSGNCRTVMIAHVSPNHQHREETRNTLIYADRAKNISKHVQKNVLDVSYHISQYRAIITELKDEIDRLKTKITVGDCGEGTMVGATPAEQQMEQKKNTEKLKRLKDDLLEHFREQMSLRNKMMDIDSNILALSMEFERQNMVVREWEAERARRARRPQPSLTQNNDEKVIDMEKDDESDEDGEPEEVIQAFEDLMYLQNEQQRYTDMRHKVEQEMMEVKERAKQMEELLTKRRRCRRRLRHCRRLLLDLHQALPQTITTDEQRELLALLCKVHELEIQKVEMQSEALLKEHELRRRDLVIMRYDRQRTLCDQIITRQRQIIEDLSPGMPPELQELYEMYQIEAECTGENDNYLNSPNNLFRSPSMVSIRGGSEKLPPINKEPEKLFDRPARRHSLGEVRRAESALSLRSPTSSASSSVHGAEPGSRVPALPPIRGARDPIDSQKNSRRLESKGLGASLEALNQISNLDSPGLTPGSRRRAKVRAPPPRRHPHHAEQQQPRRRRPISASSSDGESPAHRRSNKYHRREPASRRRGNSLGRLEGNSSNQAGMWAMGVPPASRRQSIPPPARRNQLAKPPPDSLGIAFALHR